MNRAPADGPGRPPPPLPAEEVDLWWGSCAGRTLAPSFLVCALLTGGIGLGAWYWVPERGWLQLTFFGFTALVWLVQLTRWAYRFFTWNYRLTTRYLYVDRGLIRLAARRYEVRAITKVQVVRTRLENLLHVGRVVVSLDTPGQGPVVLEGVTRAIRAAQVLRDAARAAQPQPQPA